MLYGCAGLEVGIEGEPGVARSNWRLWLAQLRKSMLTRDVEYGRRTVGDAAMNAAVSKVSL